MVTRLTPFHWTEEDALKFVPVSVRVNPTLPAVVEVGEREPSIGMGLFTVNVCAPEVPPPGAGFTTVMDNVPPTVILDDGTVMLTEELEINVVVKGTPFISMVDEPMKLVPVTVRVKFGPPAMVEVGLIEVVVGTGFETVTVLLSVEVTPEEVAHIFMLSPKEYCIAV